MKIWERNWSEGVAKQAVWLSGLVAYEQAGEILQKLGQIEISRASTWRRVEKWGEQIEALEKVLEMKAYVPGEGVELDPNRSLGRMGAGMDGTKLHLREEGWKELKVGSIFEIEKRKRKDKETQEEIEVGHAVKNGYVAHLGGPEVFGRKLWAEARQRNWMHAEDSIVIGDGASWIWNLTGEHFYQSHQIVDWYHALEHLANASKILYGEGSPKAHRWYRRWETKLYQGHAGQIATRLTRLARQHPKKSEDLRKEAQYFRNHKKRMQYLEMREEGYPIGSGMVESEAKQYKARFSGPGMRWSREGAQRLLPIRTAIMSKRFDKMWSLAYNSPPN
jgi:hypothetical protein